MSLKNITITTRKRQKNLVRFVHRSIVERHKDRAEQNKLLASPEFKNQIGAALMQAVESAIQCDCDVCSARRAEAGTNGAGPSTGLH